MSHSLLDGSLNVSRETIARLKRFEELFHRWSRQINLVSASQKEDIWRRHIEDSAQLLLIKPDMRRFVDLGSGGGFPGIVLATILDDAEDAAVHLVESNRKKTAFLMAARAECAPRAIIHSKRIEDTLPDIKEPEYITARALASLDKLLEFSAFHLTQNTIGLFHKGRGFREELEEADANWAFDLVVHESRIDPASVVLEIANLTRR